MALHLMDEAPDFTADTAAGTINFHEWPARRTSCILTYGPHQKAEPGHRGAGGKNDTVPFTRYPSTTDVIRGQTPAHRGHERR